MAVSTPVFVRHCACNHAVYLQGCANAQVPLAIVYFHSACLGIRDVDVGILG